MPVGKGKAESRQGEMLRTRAAEVVKGKGLWEIRERE